MIKKFIHSMNVISTHVPNYNFGKAIVILYVLAFLFFSAAITLIILAMYLLKNLSCYGQ